MQLTCLSLCHMQCLQACKKCRQSCHKKIWEHPSPRPSYCGASSCLSHSYSLPPGTCRPCIWAATAASMPLHITLAVWSTSCDTLHKIPVWLMSPLAMALHVVMLLLFLTTSSTLQYRSDPDRSKHVHVSNRMRLSEPHVKPGHEWGL